MDGFPNVGERSCSKSSKDAAIDELSYMSSMTTAWCKKKSFQRCTSYDVGRSRVDDDHAVDVQDTKRGGTAQARVLVNSKESMEHVQAEVLVKIVIDA
jgi:hypothetical protein